ncbi:MAG: hypothetical protein J7L23_00360 [Candidatus Diapherotrites archaeon]|nr:hypothetical protein [Candidatus Diapherotrites archaeon]
MTNTKTVIMMERLIIETSSNVHPHLLDEIFHCAQNHREHELTVSPFPEYQSDRNMPILV